ncbi:MAG: mntH [Naasia sp.]|jgi:manganese transport protein|uniref:Nramp family divalent metal transporter n=1 Tax=Naasia sp. TaxID=2546198 RepID=UPI002627CD29|nr:Nramp family divalent metal transporter [Naasia sp.]MCU1571522.1 mntH [Naasia sp.]
METAAVSVAPPRIRLWPLLGPAVVAGVAYLDPGNVASNMTGGARYGYLLIWVVVAGNAMAWLIQYLSAKLGIITGRSLPENLGAGFRRKGTRYAFWVQAELVAMATDIAEVIGGAVALKLLFNLPLLLGGLITGTVSLLLLVLQSRRGPRPFERIIAGLVLVIALGFGAGIVVGPPDPAAALAGLVPRFEDSGSVLLAASILGATVMPHAIYAHSALTRDRFSGVLGASDRRVLMRATRIDVSIALAVAGTVNVVILLVAAASLRGVPGTDTLEGAHAALAVGLGTPIATLFAIALLASGLASTSVGAYAGAEIMRGLLHINVPLMARRLVTLVPALAVLAVGVDPTFALVISQVVLSFGIPFALIPLVVLTGRRSLMGNWSNRPLTTVLAVIAAALLIVLNLTLLWLLATGG